MAAKDATAADGPDAKGGAYTVVARRYRPQSFDEVVGQDHVVRSLKNAIELNRVTHAYLFCGTRGVGKTTLARIFSKCLNCEKGPTTTPCQVCDICRAISAGQDMDVIEIDGASNNGVDAVRELRQNAGLRPSRARFKIYYIDEVHMLSTGAFNALLKTLEEPPEHVKFLFATTEVNKIPVTVLSRCQRYDLAAIPPERIAETLAEICRQEGVQADQEAIALVARRAAGSMRDAQSLLEQLLSSGRDQALTPDRVHQLLGTASDERILDLLEALARRDAAAALRQLDDAISRGVQPVDVLNGALEFLRDVMIAAAGATEVPFQAAAPRQAGRIKSLADSWSLDSALAALQILAEARGRMRGSPFGRLLVELAFVRVARLEDLAELSDVIARIAAVEAGAPAPEKKKPPEPVAAPASAPAPATQPPPTAPAPPAPRAETPAATARAAEAPSAPEEADPGPAPSYPPLMSEFVRTAWLRMLEALPLEAQRHWRLVAAPAIVGPGQLAFGSSPGYNAKDRPEHPSLEELQTLLGRELGRPVTFINQPTSPPASTGANATEALEADPLIRHLMEVFEARPVRVERDEGANGQARP